VIFYDLPPSPAALEQVRGRFDRLGRTGALSVVLLSDVPGAVPSADNHFRLFEKAAHGHTPPPAKADPIPQAAAKSMSNDLRIIEDYLPVQEIGVAASAEPRMKGHLSTLHLWRARRPLVACRAAVFGALVPESRFSPSSAAAGEVDDSSREASGKFLADLCKYPGSPTVIAEARRIILESHAERLTRETGEPVSAGNIGRGGAPRPRVLDLFAGGGSIPLEALRLGCEAHAVELNPVAHLIELCTLDFPQRFGSQIADELEAWGRRVLDRTKSAVTDLYRRFPAPRNASGSGFKEFGPAEEDLPIVAYYWTRTLPCPNRNCRAIVPLYRQTWLRKKPSGYVALRPHVDPGIKKVRFEVVEGQSEASLEFDPGLGIENTSTVCPFCQGGIDAQYVRTYGDSQGFGQQLMCLIAVNPHASGKIYLAGDSLADGEEEKQVIAEERAAALEKELGGSSLDESILPTGNAGLATGKSYLYGIRTFRQMYTPRQRCVLLTMAREIQRSHQEMLDQKVDTSRAQAITTYLGMWLSRLTDRFNTLCRWNNAREVIQGVSDMKRFAMMWDYPEVNIFGGASGDAWGNLLYMTAYIRQEAGSGQPAVCSRGSATDLAYADGTFDAVITDPPYYDNESYSELSDASYVWLRPTLGFLYPEHFSTSLTPKKKQRPDTGLETNGKPRSRQWPARKPFSRSVRPKCLHASLGRNFKIHRLSSPVSGR